MIGNRKVWENWERDFVKHEPPDFARNLRILEALYEEARALHVFPPSDPLEGLDVKVQMAKALNVSKAS